MLQYSESEARRLVVQEARTWLGTPFHVRGRVKGPKGGVDCFTIIACVFHALGLCPPWEAEFYQGDWWCHDTQNGYLRTILKYANKVTTNSNDRRSGNIVLVGQRTGADKLNVTNWHGGIVTDFPMVVHAFKPRVSEDNMLYHPAFQAVGGLTFFNPFDKENK